MKNVNLIIAIVATTLALTPFSVEAAKLNKTNTTIVSGATTKVRVNNNKKKVTWKSTGKSIKIYGKKNTITIRALKGGTSTVKAKIGKKTLRCKIKVIGKNTNIAMKTGTTLTVEVGRKGKASSSNPNVVKVENNGTVAKLYALKKGKTTITAWSPVYYTRFRVTVTGGTPVTTEKEEKTEVKIETPEQEVVDSKPTDSYETESSPEVPAETEETKHGVEIVDRGELNLGAFYCCNAKDYYAFYPTFFSPNKTADDAITWIQYANKETVALMTKYINFSNYPQEFKDKLLDILYQRVELTDDYKTELRSEFFDLLAYRECHYLGSDHTSPVSIYGPWVQMPEEEYEDWLKLSSTLEWKRDNCTIEVEWVDQWGPDGTIGK